MPDICTCGAELPPDALFCHRCGKPQRDLTPADEQEAGVIAPPVPAAVFQSRVSAPAPGFRNPVAVRVGMMMAGLATLVSTLFGVLTFVWFFAAGFAAPFAYIRRAGSPLSIREGARMGWIVGVFGSLITSLISLVGMLLFSGRNISDLREQLEQFSMSPSEIDAVLSVIRSPAGFALILAITCGFLLVLCTAGGALGAKIAQKD
jgi:hypothetical protein